MDISKDIFIFPNPAKDKIHVVLRNMAAKSDLKWEIIDITGVTLKTGDVGDVFKSNIEIPTDNLKNGIYQLRFSDRLNVLLNRFVIAR